MFCVGSFDAVASAGKTSKETSSERIRGVEDIWTRGG